MLFFGIFIYEAALTQDSNPKRHKNILWSSTSDN